MRLTVVFCAKALSLDLDCVVLDLEDGVAQNRKAAARELAVKTLVESEFSASVEKCLRINPISSPFGFDDLKSLGKAIPMIDSIVLPKVQSSSDVAMVADFLEMQYRFSGRHIRFLAFIESGMGVLNLREICENAPRLSALIVRRRRKKKKTKKKEND